MLNNDLNSLQNTISDLKEIVDRNPGANNETSLLVKQMEQLVGEIELKARKKKLIADVPMPSLGQGIPAV
jgi:hypothetical protein